MSNKEKCRKLKSIRKEMADQLGVDLKQTECTYEGECSGTCPKCKNEENILNKVLLSGAAIVTGTMLAACAPDEVIGGDVLPDPDDYTIENPSPDSGEDYALSGDVAMVEFTIDSLELPPDSIPKEKIHEALAERFASTDIVYEYWTPAENANGSIIYRDVSTDEYMMSYVRINIYTGDVENIDTGESFSIWDYVSEQ